jgi:hypothetical protein
MATRLSEFHGELALYSGAGTAGRIFWALVMLALIGLALGQVAYTLYHEVSWEAQLSRAENGSVRLEWEMRRAKGYLLEASGGIENVARVDRNTPAQPVEAQDFRELLFFDTSGTEWNTNLNYLLLDYTEDARREIQAFLSDPRQTAATVRMERPSDMADTLWLFGGMALAGVVFYIYATRSWILRVNRAQVLKVSSGLFWRITTRRETKDFQGVKAVNHVRKTRSGEEHETWSLELQFGQGNLRFPLHEEDEEEAQRIAQKVRAFTLK